MDDQDPQESEDETTSDSQLEEELEQVMSTASSLVETLADEVGTPEDIGDTPPPSPPESDSAPEEPDFMSELTQPASPSSEPTDANRSHLGAGSSTVASPEKIGVIGSANVSVIETAATDGHNDQAEEELETIDVTTIAEEPGEIAVEKRNRFVQRTISLLGSFGVWFVGLIAPLLDRFDRPFGGLSQPIRQAMGILALATLATAMVVFALSFW